MGRRKIVSSRLPEDSTIQVQLSAGHPGESEVIYDSGELPSKLPDYAASARRMVPHLAAEAALLDLADANGAKLLYRHGYAEREGTRAVATRATFEAGKAPRFEKIDVGELPADVERAKRPAPPIPPKEGDRYVIGASPPTAEEEAYRVEQEEAAALAERLAVSYFKSPSPEAPPDDLVPDVATPGPEDPLLDAIGAAIAEGRDWSAEAGELYDRMQPSALRDIGKLLEAEDRRYRSIYQEPPRLFLPTGGSLDEARENAIRYGAAKLEKGGDSPAERLRKLGYLTVEDLAALDAGIRQMLRGANYGEPTEAMKRAIERAGEIDTAAREAEDTMDAYEKLLDDGEKPVIVLCRAATRRPPPKSFYSQAATLLGRVGGLQAKSQKSRRKTVKIWCEGGRGSAVPLHCWALLLAELPASRLKERLAKIGGAP